MPATVKGTKKAFSPAAIRIIESMIEYVKRTPDMVNQNSFPSVESSFANRAELKMGVCNTPFCGAGHVVFVAKPRRFAEFIRKMAEANRDDEVDWQREAINVLGIRGGSWTLFGSASDWPDKFALQYHDATTDKGRAKAFVNFWKYVIKTDGADLGIVRAEKA